MTPALFAIGFGYLGIFPKFVSPNGFRRKPAKLGNIFYFKDIIRSTPGALREAAGEAFPNSHLSERYRNDASSEIDALAPASARVKRATPGIGRNTSLAAG